jgi:hypothetical protein
MVGPRRKKLYKIEYILNDELFCYAWFMLSDILDKWITFGIIKELRIKLLEIRWQ